MARPSDEIDNLMDLITELVATKTWEDNGGTGTISPHGNLLCVSQTFQVQCEVKAFLADFGPSGGPCRRWSSTSNGSGWTARNTSNSWAERSLRATGGRAWPLMPRPSTCLAARRPASAGGSLVPTGNWSTWPRATAARSSSTRFPWSAAASAIALWFRCPMQASSSSCVRPSCPAARRPSRRAEHGHALGQAASDGPRRRSLAVEQVTEGQQGCRPPGDDRRAAGSGSCPVQLPNMPAQQLATTVRVPLGKPVVFGGMTFAPKFAGMDQATDDPMQLYLIATTSIAADVSP